MNRLVLFGLLLALSACSPSISTKPGECPKSVCPMHYPGYEEPFNPAVPYGGVDGRNASHCVMLRTSVGKGGWREEVLAKVKRSYPYCAPWPEQGSM